MHIDITLPQHFKEIDFSFMKKPFGRSSFDPITGNFQWDEEYSALIRDEQNRMLEEYRKKLEEQN